MLPNGFPTLDTWDGCGLCPAGFEALSLVTGVVDEVYVCRRCGGYSDPQRVESNHAALVAAGKEYGPDGTLYRQEQP